MESVALGKPRKLLHFASTDQIVKTCPVPILLGSILGANVITMSVMNFLELETAALLPVYIVGAVITAVLLLVSGLKFPEIRRREHLFSLLLASLFCLPRVMYLMEGMLGYAINPPHDDWGHIQYMASIIDSPSFPPRSTFDDSQFLSYYYAPWILGAALRQTGLFSTVKQVLALTDAAYVTFACYFIVYAAKVLFADRELQKTFLILCLLYGGFDFIYWLWAMNFKLVQAEWWAADFGINIQYSNFFTLLLWVPQHVAAAMAVLYALYIASTADNSAARLSTGVLLTCAVFSSPFVVLGAIPIGLALLLWNSRLLRAAPLVLLVFTFLAVPLFWIFQGKDSAGYKFHLEWFGELSPFFRAHKQAGFIVFLEVTLLELGPLLWACRAAFIQRLSTRWLVWASASYLVSIFFIYYVGHNYCMRGAIIPIFTLTYVATPGFHKIFQVPGFNWRLIGLIPYFLGGLYEYVSFSASSIDALRGSNTQFNAKALVSNASRFPFVDNSLLRESKQYKLGWYLLEKRKRMPKESVRYEEAATFHGDNAYRVTLGSITDRLERASGGPTQALRP